MRPTLVRFGPALHDELKEEAARSGVSVAAFVREAVVARLAYSAGRRGAPDWAAAYPDGDADVRSTAARRARDESRALRDDSRALRAQGEQAVRHSEEARDRATRDPD
jgi:hypothetical protein